MKREIILVVFPNLQRGIYFVEDNILPLVGDLKKINNITYLTDRYELIIASLHNTNNLRGLSPSLVFFNDDCRMEDYDFILQLVRGEHRKIKVVI